MDDSIKPAATFGVLASLIATVVVFLVNPTGGAPIGLVAFRVALPLFGVGMLVLTVWAHRRSDHAPDYLRQLFKKRYDGNGLGFALEPDAQDGVGFVNVYYQNRFDRPCQAKITLKRRHGLALSDKASECMTALLECGGGEFGVTRVPFAVPEKYQGKKKSFEVCADVTYTSGRGRLLRFHPGKRVGGAGAGSAITIGAVLIGGLIAAAAVSSRGVRLRMRYPGPVCEELDPEARPETEILWQPGDEEIDLTPAATANNLTDEPIRIAA